MPGVNRAAAVPGLLESLRERGDGRAVMTDRSGRAKFHHRFSMPSKLCGGITGTHQRPVMRLSGPASAGNRGKRFERRLIFAGR